MTVSKNHNHSVLSGDGGGGNAAWWGSVYNWTKKSSHGQLHIIFHKPSANGDDWEYNKVKTAKWPSQDVSNDFSF